MVFENLEKEVEFSYSRSSGPGGQNVNKVSSKVTLHWKVEDSKVLQDSFKEKIKRKLTNKINAQGALVLHSDTTRSALLNKELALKKLMHLIKQALKEPKRRIATQPSRAAVKKRLEVKKREGEIKKLRRERFD